MCGYKDLLKSTPAFIKRCKALWAHGHNAHEAVRMVERMLKHQDKLYEVIEGGKRIEADKASEFYHELGRLLSPDIRCINLEEPKPSFGTYEAYLNDP